MGGTPLVSGANPTEQGLKRGEYDANTKTYSVSGANPTEQGLKPDYSCNDRRP